MEREENGIVLDFLMNGYPMDMRPSHRKTPIAQVLGIKRFILLEIVPKKEVQLNLLEELYMGEGKRDKVHHINGKLLYEKLTNTARSNILPVVKEIVHKNPQKFIDFFNKAQPLSTRMHSMELLPGVGKKHMWEIIEERKGKPFTSFEDLKERVKLIPDPEQLIVKRIMKEISEPEKHLLFVDK